MTKHTLEMPIIVYQYASDEKYNRMDFRIWQNGL